MNDLEDVTTVVRASRLIPFAVVLAFCGCIWWISEQAGKVNEAARINIEQTTDLNLIKSEVNGLQNSVGTIAESLKSIRDLLSANLAAINKQYDIMDQRDNRQDVRLERLEDKTR